MAKIKIRKEKKSKLWAKPRKLAVGKMGQGENLLPKITKRFEGVGRGRNFCLAPAT